MNTLKYLFIVLAISMLFTACGKSEPQDNTQEVQAPKTLSNETGTYEAEFKDGKPVKQN